METKHKFLSFNLGSNDLAVINLQHIAEVLQISLTEICGVPQMPNCVLGIYNWRGEMLWLVDLEEMLGYPPLLQGNNIAAKMMAIILEHDGKYLGLLVRHLTDIESLDTTKMKSPSAEIFYSAISPFVEGYFINAEEAMVFNLNALSILQSPMWGHNN
ncbi:purine-binding chemotaxis protein CheW [Calothrix sp. FACHB-1219]|uniref:chemotaxis protein CheW n=1 Tax=unclassified Calothrix TaxID=2619626 RepID=UPI0016879391|nr:MULTISPECIES: chemotaxis protein CheW [unclassified Calothrix]MBD2204520.1 purine-binding chemotaxis protein CheW [Calothrix sp. FACHB-168]MBD2219318.1 purine-binding chemotaxis protein CheW [Calothrix sp. FACHB-1219]